MIRRQKQGSKVEKDRADGAESIAIVIVGGVCGASESAVPDVSVVFFAALGAGGATISGQGYIVLRSDHCYYERPAAEHNYQPHVTCLSTRPPNGIFRPLSASVQF